MLCVSILTFDTQATSQAAITVTVTSSQSEKMVTTSVRKPMFSNDCFIFMDFCVCPVIYASLILKDS